MPVFELRSPLTAEERLDKRKLILRDLTALLSLFAITAALAVLTYLLFNSFSAHRQDLAQRWLARGRAAMTAGRPEQAVQALRSALEYESAQGQGQIEQQRQTEIELATALAAAGNDVEASAYFNTLLETEPGNGLINLEMARIAVKQGHEAEAIESYQRAPDGTWHGDGYLRRLRVRLELARYLLARHENSRARDQLLIASGNAPDDPSIKLVIAGLFEQAQDPVDAFDLYHKLALGKPESPGFIDALEGAGRTAAALGHYLVARQYLDRALNAAGMDARPEAEKTMVRNSLADAVHLLALYPGPELSAQMRAERILHDVEAARARMTECSAGLPTETAPALADLASRWQAVAAQPGLGSPGLRSRGLRSLEQNPEMEQILMTLVYDTEKTTAHTCAAPTGEDALLLRIAQAPWAVEQQ